jgi:hypothetical protein
MLDQTAGYLHPSLLFQKEKCNTREEADVFTLWFGGGSAELEQGAY